jgi:pimeloyl-ACP methyl ester carboxylesterase
MNEITLPQGTVRYRDEGKGPVLLFIHGILVAGDIWGEVVAHLEARYRCITPDWPLGSHGIPMNVDSDLSPEGMAKVVVAFMQALDLRDVTLVGNDSGGAIAQLVVARHDRDNRVARLVLTPCDAFEVFPPRPFAYLRPLSYLPGGFAFVGKLLRALPVLGRLPIAYGVTKRPVDAGAIRRWITPLATDARVRRDFVKFIRGVRPEITLSVARELPRVTMPVLLAWAREERFFPISLAERLAASFPDAELAPIDEALVFVMHDRPRALVEAMVPFLRRTERPTDRGPGAGAHAHA